MFVVFWAIPSANIQHFNSKFKICNFKMSEKGRLFHLLTSSRLLSLGIAQTSLALLSLIRSLQFFTFSIFSVSLA